MRITLRAAVLPLALALAACVSGGQSSGGALGSRDRTEISEAEVRATTQRNAYDLVQALRPEWLRKRSSTHSLGNNNPSATGSDEVMAFRDGQRLGTVVALRSVEVGDIARIRYYSASSAQQRFGSGNTNGAVEVLTR